MVKGRSVGAVIAREKISRKANAREKTRSKKTKKACRFGKP
jgi:hypothetical protein